MNIKEHIEAGHYPTDDKGRALVPMESGRIATIIATDMPGRKPIVGWIAVETLAKATEWAWLASGQGHVEMPSPDDLLPPPPRKVKVTAYALCANSGSYGELSWRRETLTEGESGKFVVVELVGEYEEPWS